MFYTVTSINERKELFNRECKVINLEYEYENYVGKEKFAIVTALSKEELCDKYADIIESYSPFVLLTIEQGAAFIEFENNEAKHRMRAIRKGHAFDISDGEFEEHHPETAVFMDIVEQIDLQDKIKMLQHAISTLPEVQKRRLIRYFFDGKTYKEIGAEEGVDYTSVRESVNTAIKKLRNFF